MGGVARQGSKEAPRCINLPLPSVTDCFGGYSAITPLPKGALGAVPRACSPTSFVTRLDWLGGGPPGFLTLFRRGVSGSRGETAADFDSQYRNRHSSTAELPLELVFNSGRVGLRWLKLNSGELCRPLQAGVGRIFCKAFLLLGLSWCPTGTPQGQIGCGAVGG